MVSDVGADCELEDRLVSTFRRLFSLAPSFVATLPSQPRYPLQASISQSCRNIRPRTQPSKVKQNKKNTEHTVLPLLTFSSPQKCSPSTLFATFSSPDSVAFPIIVIGDRRLQKRVWRIPVVWTERQMCWMKEVGWIGGRVLRKSTGGVSGDGGSVNVCEGWMECDMTAVVKGT